MQQLIKGIHSLHAGQFGCSRGLFSRASYHGRPSPALLITCADAGLLAEHLTQTNPDGFLFASGLGAFVPPANAVADGDDDSLAATIEYAVGVLQVGDIVVCGHSPCGAMGALLRGSLAGTGHPHLTWWLERGAPIQDLLRSRCAHLTNDAERQRAAELESVLISLENLSTYSIVPKPLAQGALRLHGWFFDSSAGELLAYDPATGQFAPLMAFGEGKPV